MPQFGIKKFIYSTNLQKPTIVIVIIIVNHSISTIMIAIFPLTLLYAPDASCSQIG